MDDRNINIFRRTKIRLLFWGISLLGVYGGGMSSANAGGFLSMLQGISNWVRIHITGKLVRGIVNQYGVGLPNLGASCYINSALQVLFSIQQLKEYILARRYWDPAMDGLRKLFIHMNEKNIDTDILRQPYEQLGYRNRQEDCAEFMAKLFEKLKETSPTLWYLFTYDVQTDISSENLNYRNQTFEHDQTIHLLPISLDLRENSIPRVLNRIYCQPETIEGFEVSRDRRGPAVRHQKIAHVPEYMLFQICRFDYSGGKLFFEFEAPDILNMQPYCTSNVGNVSMELIGIIVHRGDNIEHGHYFVLIKNNQGKWIKYSDNRIYVHERKLEWNETPYILLYHKLGQ
ncbi:MAG: ubiquitin carboxyl-terminal hydrolase [Puniceicoccales bacterium]|jgi:uncharacterized UBP type Zn finger protein|nr:ubiquitin carboxyl-terminal hydrolase [Puniceicoccales bacterium]